MGKKQGGPNTKVEAAKAKKAAAKTTKDVAKSAADAQAEAAEWAKGADTRAERKRQEEERKRAEQEAKKAEKQKVLALEEHSLNEDKHAIRKQKKTAKEVAKPWEEAVKPAAKKSNRGSNKQLGFVVNGDDSKKLTQAEMAVLKEAEGARIAGRPGKKEITFENKFQANRNKNKDEPTEARSLDAALDLLSVGDKELGKHPERKAKAAYKAFEEVMLPQVKEDYPGLKLSQYKHKLSEMWRRSPDNPLNQESLAYNAKKQ
uniref:HMG box domain-containing protein n=1 Tax=Peronospora matthiolae TaxID=2874970 RepID=A0AAV1TMP2_9STRA